MNLLPWTENGSMVILLGSLACAAWIAFDVFRWPQKMWIMNLVWPLTAAYSGPLGLWAYLKLARESPPQTERVASHRVRPFWQSVLIGATHCGAGCALGDVIGDTLVYRTGAKLAGSTLYADFLCALALAYLLGVGFQYFAIAPMKNTSPGETLWAAIRADTLSLLAFEVGMFTWMGAAHHLFSGAVGPANWTYWLSMQGAMLAGLTTSLPVNWWLLRSGVKHTM